MDGAAWDRLRRVDGRIWDALLALGMLAAGLLGAALAGSAGLDTSDRLLYAGLVAGASTPLAWRRRAPLVVAVVVGAFVAAAWLIDGAPRSWPALAVALYTAASTREAERLVPVLAPVVVATSVGFLGEHANWVEVVTGATFTAGVPIAYGRVVFNRRRRLARDRGLAAREAVLAERARIARELHDVVAHHMSVMVVQAGAARSVLARDADAAAGALRQIEDSGRSGLAEMRRLLDVLKSEDGADLAPQPRLGRLSELLDDLRAAGLKVEAITEGQPRDLPDAVDLSAYRIVQEALTNTLRHAGRAHASVRLRYAPDALDIEVVDDGPGPPKGDGDRARGFGLIGMRERVHLFGGTIETGARDGGGFVVRAHLPSPAPEPSP